MSAKGRLGLVVTILTLAVSSVAIVLQTRKSSLSDLRVVNQLANLGRRIKEHEARVGELPADIRVDGGGLSWRVSVLTALQRKVYDINEHQPWQHYQAVGRLETPASMFAVESGGTFGRQEAEFLAVCNKDGPFYGAKSLSELPRDLVVVIRVPNSGVHWMQPKDIEIEEFLASNIFWKKVRSRPIAVLFADGEAWLLKPSVPLEVLKRCLSVDSAKRSDRNSLLGKHVIRRSSEL